MDKNIIKKTMLSLEGCGPPKRPRKYFHYVADARLDRIEPIESDEQAQAEIASALSETMDAQPDGLGGKLAPDLCGLLAPIIKNNHVVHAAHWRTKEVPAATSRMRVRAIPCLLSADRTSLP